jgi:hypothetical protein
MLQRLRQPNMSSVTALMTSHNTINHAATLQATDHTSTSPGSDLLPDHNRKRARVEDMHDPFVDPTPRARLRVGVGRSGLDHTPNVLGTLTPFAAGGGIMQTPASNHLALMLTLTPDHQLQVAESCRCWQARMLFFIKNMRCNRVLGLTHALSLSHTLSRTLSLTHTHALSPLLTHTLSLPSSHTRSLSPPHTNARTTI